MTTLAAVIILLVASCSKQKPSAEPNIPKAKSEPPVFVEPDVGVGKVRKGMNEQQVETELGSPDSKTGGIWRYQRQGLWVLFGNNGIMFNIHCFNPFAGVTKEGIGIGSTRAEIVRAFGIPNQTKQISQGSENLWFAQQKISCTLNDDKITEIVVHLDVR